MYLTLFRTSTLILQQFLSDDRLLFLSANCFRLIPLIQKLNYFSCFRGEIVLNHAATSETGVQYKAMLADRTTPGAVLLARPTGVFRMYPNGTTDILVGKTTTKGCV